MEKKYDHIMDLSFSTQQSSRTFPSVLYITWRVKGKKSLYTIIFHGCIQMHYFQRNISYCLHFNISLNIYEMSGELAFFGPGDWTTVWIFSGCQEEFLWKY